MSQQDGGGSESNSSAPADKFGHLLRFPEEIAPVFEDLTVEQIERRKLDAVAIEKNIIFLDRINKALFINCKERIESDQLIDKLNATRLDAMQRKLVRQIETGFDALQKELDEAKERLRIATEKLYQQEVDAEVQLRQMKDHITLQMDDVQESILHQSVARGEADDALRASIPAPILEVWRVLSDERDVMQAAGAETRERCLPLEHSDLNDIEKSVAQQKIRREMKELLESIHEETTERIAEEKAQAARARALTDALARGLKIVNRNFYATPQSTPMPPSSPKAATEDT
eukprot:CAMPEP_0206231768 /NCGR_PEP_ID=MMETSP0047_2-20121206/11027_1 /ASSEMBLY_ACC=CAM_ASM_000192 /TAXON_ID=195065 /ORGANISM="Chroomonas mesostigmatica_cf, Strain CCMP1168" /LENGTH=288 /DNA_ID=CAMNT_0053655397 /DNA_START=27 /DNA_END=893 /DNA_ORIENTATION=-